MIQNQPHGSLAHFRGKLVGYLAHIGSTFSGVGASGKPGAVQPASFSIAWDTGFNPGDIRTLTPKEAIAIGADWGFDTRRQKADRKALGLLTDRSKGLVQAYVDSLDYELLDIVPIFRTRGYAPGPKGGRPRQGVPYTKNSLISDFAEIRARVFGAEEKRQFRGHASCRGHGGQAEST